MIAETVTETEEIEETAVTEETETDGVHAHLIIDRAETTIRVRRTPTLPVETIARENARSGTVDEEMTEIGAEIEDRGDEMMIDRLDAIVICLTTAEVVGGLVMIVQAETNVTNSPSKQEPELEEGGVVRRPRSGSLLQI